MSASVPPVPTPTPRKEAIFDLEECYKTAMHHGMDAHDVPAESMRVVLDELAQLTASSRALVEDAATWKEMALRLDAKVIDEQRDHVKTCGYHDETKAALKASQATNRVLIQHLREMRACVRHAVPGFITREFAEEIDAVDELLRLAPTLHAQAGEEPAK